MYVRIKNNFLILIELKDGFPDGADLLPTF